MDAEVKSEVHGSELAVLPAMPRCEEREASWEQADESGRERRVVEFVARHRASLLQYLTRILSSRQDAEDVFQETCIRLLGVRDISGIDRQVLAFVFRIATNLACDRLRRRKARFHDAHFSHETVELVGEGPLPDELIDRDMGMQVISLALLRLSPRRQRVFALHVSESLSYRTIARRLGVSTKTVERDMSTVLSFCQRRLNMPLRRNGARPADCHTGDP